MRKRTPETDFPIGNLRKVKDFLPPPERLVMPQEAVKVTLVLSKSSVEFFKTQASRHRTKYQRMIRALVDSYAAQYSG